MRGKANPLYVTAAMAGLAAVMVIVALLVVGLQHGQGYAETFLRWLAKKLRFDGDAASEALRQIGARLEDLVADRQLLKRVVLWASLNWIIDGIAVGLLLRECSTLGMDDLLVAFGLANVMMGILITPGGLGLLEGIYIPTLVGFGLSPVGHARRRLLSPCPVLVPDRLRRTHVRLAQGRAVVDRAPRATRPAARYRPAGDARERAAHRVHAPALAAPSVRRPMAPATWC